MYIELSLHILESRQLHCLQSKKHKPTSLDHTIGVDITDKGIAG
jgi:hypothetical protein